MKCYFFGTFNPIHNAHLEIAHKVRTLCGFEEVIFVPAYTPPHKIPDSAPYDRLKMTQIAAGENNVSDIEFFLPIPSYSHNTISELKKRDKTDKINFIVGYDAFSKIESWKNPDGLKNNTHFVVVPRHYEGKNHFQHLRERGWDFEIVNIDFIDISSNMIRNKIAIGENIDPYVHKKVKDYIYEHGLYRKEPQRVSER